jgi:hypothetical protein
MNNLTNEIPKYVKSVLWSYDTKAMNIQDDKNRIIVNVLNFGNKQATDWLMKTYGKEVIKKSIENSLQGDWNRKSLNFWTLIFDIDKNNIRKRSEYVL